MKKNKPTKKFPAQKQQKPPGQQKKMRPQPLIEKTQPISKGKLEGDVAIITGGDSGIGQAVAVGFANEGASTGEAFARQYV